MSDSFIHSRNVFIYLSYKPQVTIRRIEKFYKSIKTALPFFDFCIVTFDRSRAAGISRFAIGNVHVPHIIYNADSTGRLGYKNKIPGKNFHYNSYADIAIMIFLLDHDVYDNIWVSEDDVEYTGDIGELIKSIGESNGDAGLACTHVRPLPEKWEFIDWFCAGDDDVSRIPKRVCFLPFFCVTRPALAAIHAAYTRGWAGHHEMAWPMILDFAGFRIRDIGGNGPYVAPEDRNRRYIDNSPTSFAKHGSFGTMRIRLFPGREPNVLWHPVKTPRNWVRMNLKRAKSIYNWYKPRLTQGFFAKRQKLS